MSSFTYLLLLSFAQRSAMAFMLSLGEPARAAGAALYGALADALPVLLLTLAAWRADPAWGRRAVAAYTSALSVLLALDGAYFLAARSRIDGVLVRNTDLISIRAHLASRYAAYALLALAACAALVWLSVRLARRRAVPARPRRAAAALALSAAALGTLGLAPPLPEGESSVGFVNFSRNRGLAMIKVPSLASFYGAFSAPGRPVIEGDRPEYAPEEIAALEEMGLAAGGAAGAVPEGPRLELSRIVIIAAESLSRHYIRRWNPKMPEGATPFLDDLAGKYPSVDNYWAGAMPTEEAIYSILLSRPLYDVDSVAGGRLVPLFAALRPAGFRSFILRGHSHFFQDAVSLYPRLYAPDGFVAAEDISGGRRPVDFDWGFRDREVLEETVRLLERERGGPVIALVSLMDTHPPYNCEVPESELPPAVAASSGRLPRALHSTDRAIGVFFEELEARGLFDDRTLVILTSDHRPTYGNAAAFLDADDHMGWRIPLIFALKGGRARLDFAPGVSGSHIDLGPTLLGLLGLPAPEGWWGRSLLEPGRKGTGVGSADDFILAQSPGSYFWILYTDALRPPPAGDPPRVRAFKKWVRERLIGTTGRVGRQKFDAEKKRWERFSL